MTPSRAVVDTNVVIRHGMSALRGLLSSVVVQELTAGARDNAQVRRLGAMLDEAQEDGALLTPDGEDWWYAGKVLNALYLGLRSHRRGPTRRFPGKSSSACCVTC